MSNCSDYQLKKLIQMLDSGRKSLELDLIKIRKLLKQIKKQKINKKFLDKFKNGN